MKSWDGSVRSSNVPAYNKVGIPREDFGLYRCMVIDVLFVDDPRNISKNSKNPEVLYQVVILGGNATGQTLSYCRLASYLGGDSNSSEIILRKTSKDISKVKLSDHDGDIVYVQFNQGHDAYPVIWGFAKGINNNTAAKASDGPRWVDSYNGVTKTINKLGEISKVMSGGTLTGGVFTPNEGSVVKEEWFSNEKIVRTFKSGLVITEDGNLDRVQIKTAAGVTALVDGKSNKISIKAGNTEVLIDGASGKISLKGDMVDLGASVSDFVTLFTQLASAFNSHTHMYSPGPGTPSPTTPPMAPLLSSVGSQTVKVAP